MWFVTKHLAINMNILTYNKITVSFSVTFVTEIIPPQFIYLFKSNHLQPGTYIK